MRGKFRKAMVLLPLALAACGGGGASVNYRYAGPRNYAPPGPPSDPWGPYIREAAARFSIHERWIREVMQQESGGREYWRGSPITSSAGAMGLMQVMPATYAELAARYNLGPDPYDPHDNILAGAGYIAELAARFGSPGFLAAYDAGPGRLDDYMAGRSSLPNETIAYLDRVAPRLVGTGPMSGPLIAYAGTGAVAAPIPVPSQAPVQVAEAALPVPVGARLWNDAPPPAPTLAPTPPPPPRPHFSLIASAYADTPMHNYADPRWGVQVGAFTNPILAREVAESARMLAPAQLAGARNVVGAVTHPNGQTFYRARLLGITEPAADRACGVLSARQYACLAVPPGG